MEQSARWNGAVKHWVTWQLAILVRFNHCKICNGLLRTLPPRIHMLYLDLAYTILMFFECIFIVLRYTDLVCRLKNRNLYNNQLDGTVPSSIGSLGNLQFL